MQKQTTYVGMDVHARTIRVAVLRPNEAQREEWGLANEPTAVASLARRLLSEARGPVVACYEAGPTGFALMRQLRAKPVDCRVIAPALIPRKPGDRVKTDRRDARNLAGVAGRPWPMAVRSLFPRTAWPYSGMVRRDMWRRMPPTRHRSSACGCSMATACTSEPRTVGASSSSPRLQAEPRLEGGTAYRQVRPTRHPTAGRTWPLRASAASRPVAAAHAENRRGRLGLRGPAWSGNGVP